MAWLRRRGERGATAVEYALLMSLVVFGGLGAIESLEDSAADEYDEQATGIEDLPGTEGFNDGSGGTNTTVGQSTTTVVDSSPTTTQPPATTTTQPSGSSTTTAPQNTTTTSSTIVPKSTISSAADVSTAANGGKWNASVKVTIIHGVSEVPINNAVVRVRMTATQGSVFTNTCTTASDGTCTVTWTNRRNKHNPVQVSVTSVAAHPAWDQVVVNALLTKP